jgi:hypothetical protein
MPRNSELNFPHFVCLYLYELYGFLLINSCQSVVSISMSIFLYDSIRIRANMPQKSCCTAFSNSMHTNYCTASQNFILYGLFNVEDCSSVSMSSLALECVPLVEKFPSVYLLNSLALSFTLQMNMKMPNGVVPSFPRLTHEGK